MREENMNMMEVNVETFIRQIREDLEDEIYEPIIGIGKAGVGKTMSIYELTQELGIGFCELRLVTLTEVDMLGIPVIENGRTTYASNALLPDADRDGEYGILALDEITSATSTVRAGAYQLLDSKRSLGNYKLPAHWKVIGLGNGIDDGGVYQGLESAMISRATCYRVEPDANTWIKWALKNGVNSSVIAYIKWKPDKIHVFDPDAIASVFPCPRSWTALSTKLNRREARTKDGILSIEDVELYAAGSIGVDLAPDFAGFYSYKEEIADVNEILNGNAKPMDGSTRTEIVHLTIQSIVSTLDKELNAGRKGLGEFSAECVKRTANAVRWALALPRLDFKIAMIRDMSASSKLFEELILTDDKFDELCPDFMQFCLENKVLFGNNK